MIIAAETLIVDSAESFLRTSQAIISIQNARFFRKPDDEWYMNEIELRLYRYTFCRILYNTINFAITLQLNGRNL